MGESAARFAASTSVPDPIKTGTPEDGFLTFLATIKNVVFNIKCTFIFNPEAWLSVLNPFVMSSSSKQGKEILGPGSQIHKETQRASF